MSPAPAELTNSITDPRLLFKGGNCLDIQLAADPAADAKRKTPAPGDVRMLVTRQDGKPIAVIYRPKVQGFTGKPIVLNSPDRQGILRCHRDQSERIKLDYTKTTDRLHRRGHHPAGLLGLALKPGAATEDRPGLPLRQRHRQAGLRALLLDQQQLLRQRHQRRPQRKPPGTGGMGDGGGRIGY